MYNYVFPAPFGLNLFNASLGRFIDVQCGVTACFFETLKAGLALPSTKRQRRVPLVSDQNKLVVEFNLTMEYFKIILGFAHCLLCVYSQKHIHSEHLYVHIFTHIYFTYDTNKADTITGIWRRGLLYSAVIFGLLIPRIKGKGKMPAKQTGRGFASFFRSQAMRLIAKQPAPPPPAPPPPEGGTTTTKKEPPHQLSPARLHSRSRGVAVRECLAAPHDQRRSASSLRPNKTVYGRITVLCGEFPLCILQS